MPDRVWGPAWVTWRTGGDCCGWAPLPPHAEFGVGFGWRFNGVSVGVNFGFGLGVNAFAFVSFGDFCSHDIGHCCLPPARVTTVYKQTTIVNNYVVNNNTIVNRGIPIDRVSSASRTSVPRATVRDLPAGGARVADRTGSVVYRHQLQAPARPVNMVAQRVDAQHPAIQHGPITPVNTGRPSGYGSASAPGTTLRQPTAQAPRTSSWSSGAKPASSPQYQAPQRTYQPSSAAPAAGTSRTTSDWSNSGRPASSPQYQSTPRTSQPATTTLPATAAPRAPEDWKQGSRVMPGYRSDTGLPAYTTPRTPVQTRATTGQTSSESEKGYYPKGYHQAAELRSPSQSAERQSSPPSSSGKSSDSHSRKGE